MGLFFAYILKSSVCLAVFYLFYRLLLSRETFHCFNRFVLLSILFLSCLLPLIEVSVRQESEVHQAMFAVEQWLLADAVDAAGIQAQEVTVTWIQVALTLYLLGIFLFACRHLYLLTLLLKLLKTGRRESIGSYIPGGKKVALIVHDSDIAPFSWMKYIAISRKDLDENGREILIHELAHIRNRHSSDLLIADICIFLQWFNPTSWLLKRELQNIHEYEADETVIKEGVDAKQYQLLLIKKAVGTRLYSMANSFNHSKLKKRITMMLKEKSNPWACLKYLYVLPVAAMATIAFARPEVSDVTKEISAVKVNDLAVIVETKIAESVEAMSKMPKTGLLSGDTAKLVEINYIPVGVNEQLKGTPVFVRVEEMPEFPGGHSALMEYLCRNMQYPSSARQANIQGRVVVHFTIDKDGSIQKPNVLRSVEQSLDTEAIRLVKTMPKWKPGRQKGEAVPVKYTVPVVFKLEETDEVVNLGSKENASTQIDASSGLSKAFILVNGIEMDPSLVSAINPDKIELVKVLKGAEALKEYGEKGKNGVILITLKKEETPVSVGEKN